eukprot:TRINITY_DN2589_c0_g7_i3.p1 TRINITY_DN2589_c0_g7~~TRINITY_DN2589_c0_g7_i3.p1  ORF type:complete len:121 (-),score=0.84 TRINITY_DN2589_c0_g7_i3:76-438(-)
MPLQSLFPTLSFQTLCSTKVRNKVKEYFILLKANSLPLSVGKSCPICPDTLTKNHIFRCRGLNHNCPVVTHVHMPCSYHSTVHQITNAENDIPMWFNNPRSSTIVQEYNDGLLLQTTESS